MTPFLFSLVRAAEWAEWYGGWAMQDSKLQSGTAECMCLPRSFPTVISWSSSPIVVVAPIVPPPRHHVPSYNTTACPGETPMIGVRSCTVNEESGLWRIRETSSSKCYDSAKAKGSRREKGGLTIAGRCSPRGRRTTASGSELVLGSLRVIRQPKEGDLARST